MPTHLLLEGEDIESVLAELRESHGPDAKIVQAEMVRVGGFAGFFAKRRYEVTVELDEDGLLADGTPGIGGTALMPARPEVVHPEVSAHQAVIQQAAARKALAQQAAAERASSGIDALLSAAEQGDQAEISGAVLADAVRPAPAGVIPTQGWHRTVSTEGDSFGDIFDSITQNLTDGADQADQLDQIALEPVLEPARPRPYPRAIDALEPILQEMLENLEPEPEPEPVVVAEPVVVDEPVVQPVVEPVVEAVVEAEPTVVAEVAAEVVAEAEPAALTLGPDLVEVRARLAGIGLPASLLAQVSHEDPLLALRDAVGQITLPGLPAHRSSATRGGALMVVVGEWSLARATVTGLVRELGADPDAVFAVGVATGADLPATRMVRSHSAGVALVRQARQDHDIAVLVVDPGATKHTAARAAELLVTLEPQGAVVMVDATADLGAGMVVLDALDQAGVGVDALAVDGAHRAARPAAVLEVPLPVSMVDGARATAGGWLGLLMDALED